MHIALWNPLRGGRKHLSKHKYECWNHRGPKYSDVQQPSYTLKELRPPFLTIEAGTFKNKIWIVFGLFHIFLHCFKKSWSEDIINKNLWTELCIHYIPQTIYSERAPVFWLFIPLILLTARKSNWFQCAEIYLPHHRTRFEETTLARCNLKVHLWLTLKELAYAKEKLVNCRIVSNNVIETA